jgi:hypothetical protein
MTHAQDDAVSDVSLDHLERTIIDGAAAVMASLAAHRSHHDLARSTIPLPSVPPVAHGANPSNVDWDHVITEPVRPKAGQRFKGLVIDARVYPAWDVEMEDVVITGGTTLPTAPRPVAEFGPGMMLHGVTIEPAKRSVMWGDGVRHTVQAFSDRLLIRGTVDGLGIVTPTGQRTDAQHVDLLIEDLPWYATDPNHPDGSHNDGIQFHGPAIGVKLLRPIIRLHAKATACVMDNGPRVEDFTLAAGDLSGAKSGVNFHKTPGANVAVVDTRIASPDDVYALSTLPLRLDRSTRPDGSPVVRKTP